MKHCKCSLCGKDLSCHVLDTKYGIVKLCDKCARYMHDSLQNLLYEKEAEKEERFYEALAHEMYVESL